MILLNSPAALGLTAAVGGLLSFGMTNESGAPITGFVTGVSTAAALASYHGTPKGANLGTAFAGGMAIGSAINLARNGVEALG